MSAHASSHDLPYFSPDGHTSFFRKYIWSTDHKVIGLQYLFTSLALLLLGGGLALGVRWQIGFPETQLMTPGFYNMLVTMHATVMVFFVVMPLLIGFFGNFLIPLMIGAKDMAFPHLNAASYWLFFTSAVIICCSFFVEGGAAAGGWTSYAPLSSTAAYNHTQMGQTLWALAIFVNGLASIAGAVNYITTIVNLRAPGMGFFRMPLTVWSLFITSVLLLLAVPVLGAAGVMLIYDLNFGTQFFTALHGQPLLYQHLFWFFGHPEVYIMILPAMGVVSDIMVWFCRKPIFGYKAMAYAMIAIGFLGFIVWGHHMFVSGMSIFVSSIFSLSTMLIAVPSAIKVFNWLGTIYGGNIRLKTPMLFAIGFISMFIIGGLSGIFMASATVDLFIHHTYLVVAHFHYVLFGGSIFSIFAGIYGWYPKMFGRMMNENWGKVHFALTFVFFNCVFFPMHNLGIGGMMRRIADPTVYEHLRNLQPINQFVTISAILLGISQLVFFTNFFYSMFRGAKAGNNPWEATTLEWQISSPPTHHNFDTMPHVYCGPYEYSVPNMKSDFLPQTVKHEEVETENGQPLHLEAAH
ncbi:MAG: cbb3-type cytochrome c oxidase subunit I [Verrucomicrobiota bacterium]